MHKGIFIWVPSQDCGKRKLVHSTMYHVALVYHIQQKQGEGWYKKLVKDPIR